MQSVGRAYAQYFNKRHQRTGTLWEGRYRATVLEAQTYLLPCMAFIDSNPVRSGMVAQAADYPWSSAAHWLGLRHDRMLSPHAAYWALGNTRLPARQPMPPCSKRVNHSKWSACWRMLR